MIWGDKIFLLYGLEVIVKKFEATMYVAFGIKINISICKKQDVIPSVNFLSRAMLILASINPCLIKVFIQ